MMVEAFVEFVERVRTYGGEVDKINLSPSGFHALASEVRQQYDLALYVGYLPTTGEFYFRFRDVLVCSPPNQVVGI